MSTNAHTLRQIIQHSNRQTKSCDFFQHFQCICISVYLWNKRRIFTSCPKTWKLTPPIREAVPSKQKSMTSWCKPTASKIWAPCGKTQENPWWLLDNYSMACNARGSNPQIAERCFTSTFIARKGYSHDNSVSHRLQRHPPCSCAGWRFPFWPWPWRFREHRQPGSSCRFPRWRVGGPATSGLAAASPPQTPGTGKWRLLRSQAKCRNCGSPYGQNYKIFRIRFVKCFCAFILLDDMTFLTYLNQNHMQVKISTNKSNEKSHHNICQLLHLS